MRPPLIARVAFVTAAIFIVWWGGRGLAASFDEALDAISVDDLRRHVDHLADDALAGRQPGTRGGREAGKYIAAQFEKHQLLPAGSYGYFQPFGRGYRNVLAMFRGAEADRGQEVIIVGAHYDHVGYGNRRNSRGPIGYIHNGADDNASGTAGLIEIARAMATLNHPPKRTILLAAWDAEEMGMLGSKHWMNYPTVDRHRVVFLLNMDMIGRLRANQLTVLGSRSAYGLRRRLASHNDVFQIAFAWTTKPNADHWPFFDANIPILTLNTGLHDQYHTPADDPELINHEGIRQVIRMAMSVVYDLANAEAAPQYRVMAKQETDELGRQHFAVAPAPPWMGARSRRRDSTRAGTVPADRTSTAAQTSTIESAKPLRLGISWRVDPAEPGTVVLVRVVPDSPSHRAGLVPGDRIYQVAGQDFADDREFARRVKTLPGPLELLVERDGRLRKVVLTFEHETEGEDRQT